MGTGFELIRKVCKINKTTDTCAKKDCDNCRHWVEAKVWQDCMSCRNQCTDCPIKKIK